MDKSNVNQHEFSYSFSKGNAYINNYTGRLLLDTKITSIGMNNFHFESKLVYNSHYLNSDFGKELGLGNGFKLNFHQYVFEYNDNYELDGFIDGDYVYIDANYMIHRFTKPENSNDDMYYDSTSGNLYLYINSDNTLRIVDENDNKLLFNSSGRLTNIISGINSNINKQIVYTNNLITEVYDIRDENRKMLFEYTDNKLSKVYDSFTNIGYNFEFSETIVKVTKYNNIYSKDYLLINLNNLVESIFDCESNIGLEFTYTDNKVTKVKKGTGDIEYLKEFSSEHFTGDDIYSGDNIYVDNNVEILNGRKYTINDHVTTTIDVIDYQDNVTKVKNKDNITISYFLNALGETVSVFEEVDNKLYSLEYRAGDSFDIIIENDEDTKIINECNAIKLFSNDNTLEYNVNNLDYYTIERNSTTNNKEKEFELSFYYLCDKLCSKDKTIKLYVNDECTDEVILSSSKPMTWQEIVIYGKYNDSISSVRLEISKEDINEIGYLCDIKVNNKRKNKILVNEHIFNNEVKIYYKTINNTKYLNISSDFYMTEEDIRKTYKNIYLRKINKNDTYLLSLCNGRKRINVLESGIIINSIETKFDIDVNGIANYKVYENNSLENQILETNLCLKFDHNDTNDIYEIKLLESKFEKYDEIYLTKGISNIELKYYKNNLLSKIEKHTTDLYEVHDEIEYYIKDNNAIVINEIKYDEYGNILSEMKAAQDDILLDENIENMNYIKKSYTYKENDSQMNELIASIVMNGVKEEFEYKDDKLIKYKKGGLITKYIYDKFNEEISKIEFYDLNERKLAENKIKCNKLKNSVYLTNNNDIKIELKNNYYNNIQEIFINDNLLKSSEVIYDKNINQYERIEKYYKNKTEIKKEYLYNKYSKLVKESTYDNKYYYEFDDYSFSKINGLLKRVYDENDTEECTYSRNNSGNINEIKINGTFIINYDEKDLNKITYYYIKDNSKIVEVKDNSKSYYILYDEDNNIIKTNELLFTYSNDKLNRFKNKYGPYLNEKGLNIEKHYEYEDFKNTIKKISIGFISNQSYDLNYEIHYTYDYDDLNNIESVIESVVAGEDLDNDYINQISTDSYNYHYDSLNRLDYEIINGNKYDYKYDTNGDLSEIYLNDSLVKKFTYTNGLLTKYIKGTNEYNIEYDLNGNIIKLGDKEFLYDYNNRLESYKYKIFDIDYIVKYKYNYKGERIKKELYLLNDSEEKLVNTVDFYVNNGIILGEDITNFDNENQSITKYRYFYDKEGITALQYNGSNYYFIKDLLGNITKVVHEGVIIGEYSYDAWGNVTEKEFEDISDDEKHVLENNPFRYRGYYYDDETNLFLVTSSYYSPELGRFIQPADVSSLNPSSINGLNLYSYANNNPIGIAYSSSNVGFGNSGGMVSPLALGGVSTGGVGGSTSVSRNLPPVPGWMETASSIADPFTSFVGPVRTAINAFTTTDLWDLMRLDGIDELPGILSKSMKIAGYGLAIFNAGIVGYEKYASGASLSSALAGTGINACIGIGSIHVSTLAGSFAVGLLSATALSGGWIVLLSAGAAFIVGTAVNHLLTKLEIGGNTIEGHLNNLVDWLIWWD